MFLLFSKILNSLCLAPDGSEGGGGTAILDKDTVIDFLKGDDADEGKDQIIDLDEKKDDKGKEVKEGEEGSEEETEEVDELAEIEDELAEPDEEKLQLDTPVPRREIIKKYPKLFEDFPYLEKAYYRDQQFSRMFETPAEAKD